MRLSEISVAAEHALQNTVSDKELWKSLSSPEEFEVFIFSNNYTCINIYSVQY